MVLAHHAICHKRYLFRHDECGTAVPHWARRAPIDQLIKITMPCSTPVTRNNGGCHTSY